jgi:pimeloyl-ACP methyl ester carboxylesterase
MTKFTTETRYLNIGTKIHIRLWTPDTVPENGKKPFLLLHGLSSNARTWDQVAARLAMAGHPAGAIDQRGHGLSGKPENGYEFDTFTQDLLQVMEKLGWRQPILAGQSWGGNVLLDFAGRFPGLAAGYVFVDGGYLDLKKRGPWEKSAVELKPPDLIGTQRSKIAARLSQMYPGWSKEGIEATLENFEILPDQTVRPWLTLERHMKILRSMYDQDPSTLFPKVKEPVLICAADDGSERMDFKRVQVEEAVNSLPQAELCWFDDCKHDIHVDRPIELAARMLEFYDNLMNKE